MAIDMSKYEEAYKEGKEYEKKEELNEILQLMDKLKSVIESDNFETYLKEAFDNDINATYNERAGTEYSSIKEDGLFELQLAWDYGDDVFSIWLSDGRWLIDKDMPVYYSKEYKYITPENIQTDIRMKEKINVIADVLLQKVSDLTKRKWVLKKDEDRNSYFVTTYFNKE